MGWWSFFTGGVCSMLCRDMGRILEFNKVPVFQLGRIQGQVLIRICKFQ